MAASNLSTSQDLPATLELGRRGEKLAAAYLQQLGYRLVASNFSVPVGRNRNGAVINVEIDLVAYEALTLCFIEVKARASDWFAVPSVNVDLRKQRQIIRAARAYRRLFGITGPSHRYDVVSIVFPDAGEGSGDVQIELLRGFWSEEKFARSRRSQLTGHVTERYWY